jgi:hypothetical protein
VEVAKPDIISSTEKHLDMPAHQPVSAIAQQFSHPQPVPDIQRHSVEPVRVAEPIREEPVRVVEPIREEPVVVVQKVVEEKEEEPQPEVISEQELIEQLKNDHVEVVGEEDPEQFVLSPDNPGITVRDPKLLHL